MKWFRYFYFLLLLWCLPAPVFVFASESVTLEKYLNIVKTENRTLLANLSVIEAAYYGVLASVSPQRPVISGGLNTSYLTGQGRAMLRENDIMSSNAEIRLSWRIDVSGSYSLDERQQILSYESQRASLDNSINTLIAAAEEAYWSAVLARENIVLQKDVLRQRTETHRVTEVKYEQQMVPRLDILRSESQVVAAESLVSRAESQYRNALERMADLAGGVKVVPAEDPLLVPVFGQMKQLEAAVLYRPDVKAGRLNLDRSRTIKKLTAKGLSPTLDFGVSFVPFADPWSSPNPQDGEMSASLRLNIPIVDGNATKYKILNADRSSVSEEYKVESLENTARTEFAVALNNWNDALVFEQDKKRQVERSDEELAIAQLLYNEGMGAQIELINAQTDNQQVRTEHLNAVKEMYVALVAIRKAAGDYAPNENGSWKEAVALYGKGNRVTRSEEERSALMEKAKAELAERKKAEDKR